MKSIKIVVSIVLVCIVGLVQIYIFKEGKPTMIELSTLISITYLLLSKLSEE